MDRISQGEERMEMTGLGREMMNRMGLGGERID